MGLKKTSLNEVHKKLGGKLVDFTGWELPIQFEGIKEEHFAVREKAGLFDVSHMGEFTIDGSDALKFVDYIVANDASAMNENQVMYTFMCNEKGGVVDDLLVYKYTNEKILLVVNAANIEKDYNWVVKQAKAFDVVTENISDNVTQIAIQGPKAQEILQKITDTDLNEIKFFTFNSKVLVAGVECIVSRTGYTGEDGFEVYLGHESAVALAEVIIEAGGEDLSPIGLGARDTLRFEAGLPLYGNELGDNITPLESGLGFFVKLEAGDFIGKDVLVAQKRDGLTRRTAGFKLTGKGIARGGYKVFAEGKEIGYVTTGYKLPGQKESIGIALINIEYAKIGKNIQVEIRNKLVDAEVISKKFLEKKYKK
ncbi:MAG: glycine cleavage system aminomethyltransferase GcvT [Psychrilyobacter sp.]|uniref:glycine cleavage system aminomethyltransferase GcvT n=1 Tax=Psychrilyobacter sp. TaxID=2586924 RepID=UPI003C7399CF